MNSNDLTDSSATTLAQLIRRKEVSSYEVISAHLERLDRLNPLLNTVIQVAPESALEQARAAEESLARGERPGPLHGVPVTVKDVYAVHEAARLVTAPGIVERPDPAPERDSTVVQCLRSAGAILIAVTKATLWTDREERYGYSHNPYDLERTPGGSSGGEAATIAAGGSPLGFGSDSGGSLRHPAHYCGVATLRPSNGRVPRASDADGTNDPRTVAGPLARSIEDVALAFEIIAGVSACDPTTLPLAPVNYRDVRLKGLRVGVFTDNGIVSPTPETIQTVNAAARSLENAGAIVEEVAPPQMEESWEITLDYWRSCREEMTLPDYFSFLRRWDRYRVTMNTFMQAWEALICPVEAFPAPRPDATNTPATFTYCTPFSLVGWPCAVVRAGTSPEDLPIGVQIVGAPWRDDVALALARQIELSLGGWRPSQLCQNGSR